MMRKTMRNCVFTCFSFFLMRNRLFFDDFQDNDFDNPSPGWVLDDLVIYSHIFHHYDGSNFALFISGPRLNYSNQYHNALTHDLMNGPVGIQPEYIGFWAWAGQSYAGVGYFCPAGQAPGGAEACLFRIGFSPHNITFNEEPVAGYNEME